jgi:hypothetical protein
MSAEADSVPTLTPGHAAELMRKAVRRDFPVRWRIGTHRHVACPVRLSPPRPGKYAYVRRRCFFHWTSGRVLYHGQGSVWLSPWQGKLYWLFTFWVRYTQDGKPAIYRQSGNVGQASSS